MLHQLNGSIVVGWSMGVFSKCYSFCFLLLQRWSKMYVLPMILWWATFIPSWLIIWAKRPGLGREFISLPHPATGRMGNSSFRKYRNWCFDTCQKCIWSVGIFMSLPQRPHVSIFFVSAKETHEILVPIILEFGPTSVEISLLKKGEWIGGALHPKEHCHLRPVEEIKLGLLENSPLGSMILPTKNSKTLSFSFISRGFSNFSYISHDLPIDFPMQI